MKSHLKSITLFALGFCSWMPWSHAGTITIVGNGGGGTTNNPAGLFVTSQNANIALGTRLYIGAFSNLSTLTTTINNFTNGTATYAATFAALTNNFINLGTGAANFGNVGQTTGTTVTNQFVFNTTANLAVNGAPSATFNVFTGNINSVNYSTSLGLGVNMYMWTAFNDEIAIVRNSDGSGNTAWITPNPASDNANFTLSLAGINSQSEVLLGKYLPATSGSYALIQTAPAIPEPSAGILFAFGAAGLMALRRLRKV